VNAKFSNSRPRPAARLSTPEEVAEYLAVPRRKVMRMAREGSLPAVRLSQKLVRFDLEQVRKHLVR